MRHGADVVITAGNEGEITAAAQAVSAAHAGRRAIGVVATACSAEDFEPVYELTERELGPVAVVVNSAGDRALPDRPIVDLADRRSQRLLEQSGERNCVGATVAHDGLECGRIVPSGDQVGTGVFVVPTRPNR